MIFEGEHLWAGQLGQFLIILSFFAALVATISYFYAGKNIELKEKTNWLKTGRIAFLIQLTCSVLIFSTIIFICANHWFEYMYAYKHSSLELEYKYLLACVWEGQEGSFLLWAIWNGILGAILIKKAKDWEAPVMSVISLAQVFLMMMILGVFIGSIKIGNSPFTLTRNEIAGPIFERANYLTFIKDGVGLNLLLRNYWMVIHPPILFLGFSSTIIPFAYAYAGIKTKRYADWVKPAMPWALMCAAVLGVGIMMGGKWAYESLNFGGYWAWDPVENASLVPWLLLIAGIHTMLIYKATGHSLRASYVFILLTFIFILYSTFLTRTGILGDTSVHAFTETGELISFNLFGHLFEFRAMNALILLYLLGFTLPALFLLAKNYTKIPTIHKEENTNAREFWMFIGSLVLFLSSIFIIAKTSVPVFNKIANTSFAPPEDVEFGYNKVMVLVAIILGLLTAVTQYLKFKDTEFKYLVSKIGIPTAVAAVLMGILAFVFPLTYFKSGYGYLAAIYVATFTTLYAVVANAMYIWSVQKGKLLKAGSPIAHAGFMLMLFGMLLSSANKKIISSSSTNGITLPTSGKDPMTKQEDDPRENLTLLRKVPATLGDYSVTFLNDSLGTEKGRTFYNLAFENKNNPSEKFGLQPNVYLMKGNSMTSNPDTKSFLLKDVFTYVSYAVNKNAVDNSDTAQFRLETKKIGDTIYYSNGFMILENVGKNTDPTKLADGTTQNFKIIADLKITSKTNMHYTAAPSIVMIDSTIAKVDDTLYAQNMFVRFAGIADKDKFIIGIKESDKLIESVTIKAYVFPMINLVWLGLVIMAMGITISMLHRGEFTSLQSKLILLAVTAFIFYMFLIAKA
jgi:cytochrome c-type biogenesis protein CcmF